MDESAPGQSMEEILASIRQVISADADAARHLRDAMPPPPEDREEDILELGQTAPSEDEDGPTSDQAEDRVEEAGKPASATLAGIAIDPHAGANTLDGMVREMLRPMLKEWLDAHLPELVERAVAREVRR